MEKKGSITVDRVGKSDAVWRKERTPEQFQILRRKGTEEAFTGKYGDRHDGGVFRCAACENDLSLSGTKPDSGTGWPSFYEPVAPENSRTTVDRGFFTTRTEVVGARCDGRLGDLFHDGPKPTGLRYCINAAALDFRKAGWRPGNAGIAARSARAVVWGSGNGGGAYTLWR